MDPKQKQNAQKLDSKELQNIEEGEVIATAEKKADEKKTRDLKKRIKMIGIAAGIILVLLLVCICSSATISLVKAFGSQNVISEERDVDSFKEIESNVKVNIIFEQGSPSLEIEAEDNIIDRITTEVQNGKLIIKKKSSFPNLFNFLFPRKDINITVSSTDLDSIVINGNGKFTADTLTLDSLKITTSGSSNIDIVSLKAFELKSTINGSAKYEISGELERQTITINGSGDYYAENLVTEDITIDINGSGNVQVNALDELDIDIAGSGEVQYKGDPRITQNISGSGSVNKIE
jgi:hypothetical protein